MEKVPQKLEKTRAEMYANAPIAKYGERKPDFSTMGRNLKINTGISEKSLS